jgi:hypothetical protein
MAEVDQFTMDLRIARLAEAARVESVVNLNEARSLRLQNLQAELQARLVNNARAKDLVELRLEQGSPPRLWLDLVTSVVMEPDPRTYRLQQDQESSRETLFETGNMTDMAAYATRHLARQIVVREKLATALVSKPKAYTVQDMIYVWIMGVVFGSMALLMIGLYLGKIQF